MQILIFALVALCLAAGGMAYDVLKTQNTSALVQQRTTSGGLLTQAHAVLVSESTDIDQDGFPESPAMEPSASAPVGGGVVPATSGAPKGDVWGTAFGYCAFDLGSANTSTGRIPGSTSASQSSVVFALISAGADKVFQTACAQAKAGQVQGDDGMRMVTVAQLRQGVGGTQYYGDPVADDDALASLNTASLKNGEQRLVLSSNVVKRWDAAASNWASISGGGGGGFPNTPGYGTEPAPIMSQALPEAISLQTDYSFALAGDSGIYAAGSNSGNVWGEPDTTVTQKLIWYQLRAWPSNVSGVIHAPMVADGRMVRSADGALWALGTNTNNRFGAPGAPAYLTTWTQVIPPGQASAQVVMVPKLTAYLNTAGQLMVAGSLISNGGSPVHSTTAFKNATGAASVAAFSVFQSASDTRACVARVDTNGDLWSLGDANFCGTANTAGSAVTWTLQMQNVAGVTLASSGSGSGCAYAEMLFWIVKSDGTLWRKGSTGSCGSGPPAMPDFTQVPFTDLAKLNCQSDRACFAIKKDGTLWMHNYNQASTLGTGLFASPAATEGEFRQLAISDVVAAYATKTSDAYSLASMTVFALKSDGTVWAIGANQYGKFGINSTTTRYANWTRVL